MKRIRVITLLVLLGLLAFPPDCPAPLVWRPGEGWTYERHGMTVGKTPQEQLQLGKEYQKLNAHSEAISAFRRLIKLWPAAAVAEDARLGMAESYSALHYHYRAFQEYQALIEKHPNTPHFETVLKRQFEIGNLFMAGERDKAFGIRWFPNRNKAITIFEQVVKNGPYTEIGPQAQLHVGLTHEKLRDYVSAVRAYEKLAERYPRHPLAEQAYFRIGMAYRSESARAEYDQNAANQSIASFSEFLIRYPKSELAAVAEQYRTDLKQEQARGLFRIGQFYEKKRAYPSAIIYYNEVIEQNPESDWATNARDKISVVETRTKPDGKEPTAVP